MASIMANRTQQMQQMLPNNEMHAKAEVERRLQNPNLAQRFQLLMQQYGGKSYWDIAFDLASQRGIDLKSMLRRR